MAENKTRKLLFFFVHPSKFHFFRNVINRFFNEGHIVEIVIISKDVLEPLVINEGWNYINIFPEGRQSKSKNRLLIIWKTGINFFKTIIRLHRVIGREKYDLFITDDCLVINGWYKKIKSLFFIDNELTTVPESSVLCYFATKIIAPESVKLGRFERKKYGFRGYKELAYLHPDVFTPDISIIKEFNPDMSRYFIIRLVSMTASHDRNLSGISDVQLKQIIDSLSPFGKIYISAEKELPQEFNDFALRIKPNDITHVLYFSDLFIGDSGTMASEAAVLGTPSIMFHDFVDKLGVMKEKEEKYGLMYGFKTERFEEMLVKAHELIACDNSKQEWIKKRDIMLHRAEDINDFLYKKTMDLSN